MKNVPRSPYLDREHLDAARASLERVRARFDEALADWPPTAAVAERLELDAGYARHVAEALTIRARGLEAARRDAN